jgi:hypothetical protein
MSVLFDPSVNEAAESPACVLDKRRRQHPSKHGPRDIADKPSRGICFFLFRQHGKNPHKVFSQKTEG